MRSRLTVAVVAVACLVGAPGGAWALEEIVPPVGTDHEMTLAELRYCIFQGVRLKSANDALDASSRLEIDRFNEWVDDWNARCASYRHLPSDLDAAETSAVLKRIQLETEGKALVIGLRTARAASVYHVTASALNLRAGPDPSQSIIGRLERFEDLRATGPTLGEWLPVEVDGMAGYVARAYVMQGSGEAPRRAYCRSIAGARPENGEILAGEGNGRHVVRVTNGHAKDVLFKLKDSAGRTRLAFYVVAGQTAEIGGVPDGEYRLMFASGDGFSRGCNRFIDTMHAKVFDRRKVFETVVEGDASYFGTLSITLPVVEGSNVAANDIDLDAFDD